MLWEEVVRVPFVIRRPGAGPENQVDRTHLVSGVDLLPTLCDYANIAAPEGCGRKKLYGRLSRIPLYRGVRILLQSCSRSLDDETKKGRMLRTARYKYIAFSHGRRPEMLFDIEVDPGETQNLAYQSEFAEVLSEHRKLLKREVTATADSFDLQNALDC